mgnify:CR=1 FL=1
MSEWDENDAFEAAVPQPVPPTVPLSQRAMAARPAPYLDDLNPAQRAAVEALDGPVLMLAGAGTGKTKALTARIVHLLNMNRARPNEILAVTFTNKAAREMRARVGRMLGDVADGMAWMGTFHSLSVKILRRHAELVGLKSNFTILDTDDQLRLLKQLIVAGNIDEKRWPARQLAGCIDRWKNKGLGPAELDAGELVVEAHPHHPEAEGLERGLLRGDVCALLLKLLSGLLDHLTVLLNLRHSLLGLRHDSVQTDTEGRPAQLDAVQHEELRRILLAGPQAAGSGWSAGGFSRTGRAAARRPAGPTGARPGLRHSTRPPPRRTGRQAGDGRGASSAAGPIPIVGRWRPPRPCWRRRSPPPLRVRWTIASMRSCVDMPIAIRSGTGIPETVE